MRLHPLTVKLLLLSVSASAFGIHLYVLLLISFHFSIPSRWHCWHPRAEDLKNPIPRLPGGKDQRVTNGLIQPPPILTCTPLDRPRGYQRASITVTAE